MATKTDKAASASTSSFAAALIFNAAVFGVEILIFTLIRPYFKAIYEPRTYVPVPSKRIAPLAANLLGWPLAVFKADHTAVLHANGADAYFFVRFLRMMARVFLPMWLISWAVLLPITGVNTRVGANDGLNLLIFGNIEPDKQARYWAHLVLAYVFTFWIFHNIRLEMTHYVTTRQQYLINPVHAKSVQANTLLVTGIPVRYLTPAALHTLFKDLPGGVKRIWINRNLRELPDVFDRRLAACGKLEGAETKLLAAAAKLQLKAGGAVKDAEGRGAPSGVPPADRPTHKLGFLGLLGEKVDTIDWARSEIAACNKLLAEGRREMTLELSDPNQTPLEDEDGFARHDDDNADAEEAVEDAKQGKKSKADKKKGYPAISSAFITFNRQIAAHMAQDMLLHHEPYRMTGRYSEVSPQDVIWSNLGLNPYEMKLRMLVSYALTGALVVFWAIPVSFVGIISNLKQLCTSAPWLAWICKIPESVLGIISGILPPVLLAVLMMLLPIILRLFAQFEGIPKRSGVELSLMSRFFLFQVVHSFLIVTISAGIAAAISDLLKNPTSIPTLLSQKLPEASTFFLTYTILQGLAGTAGGFLQIVPLVVYYVKLFLLGSTPRSIYGIKYGARSVAWGTTFPGVTLLVVIALVYSIISPVINGLACFTFFMFYQLYKYLFLWQFEQPPSSDTGGLFFPKAISQLFVGLYISEICLAALFFLARNDKQKPSSVPQAILMLILIGFTILFQLLIGNSYGPLSHSLPLSLADKTFNASPTLDRAGTSNTDANGQETHEMKEQHPRMSVEEAKPLREDQKIGGLAARVRSEEEYGFAHPAASRPQRIVWFPRDRAGFSEEEVSACEKAGVHVSTKDAELNEKGKVDISGPPPDLVLVDE